QEYIVDRESYFSFFDFTKRMAHNNYGRFVLYLCVFTFVVYLASPFFAVYMLRDLKFSYMTFTLITLGSLIASFAGMHFWGRYNDENGSKKLIYFNGLLIPFLPIMWLFTTNVYALFAIEMFSGFVWAGFNLGTSNFIFDATTPQKRMRCITYYNVLRALAMFLGATIGGLLATHTSSSVFISSIPILFLVSGILRLIVSLMFLPMLKEMRLIEVPLGHSTFRTYLTIKPKEGIVYETIGTHKKESGNSKDDNSKEDGKIKFKLEEKNLSEKEVLNKNLDKYLNKKKLKQTKDK
ncbi:MAG: MFS transporter, partial [Nanoarchaeota archaeon]|nr:MFS transporter [Nanoarchaeota archaeon]